MTFGFIFILGFSGLLFLAPKNRTKYRFNLNETEITNWIAEIYEKCDEKSPPEYIGDEVMRRYSQLINYVRPTGFPYPRNPQYPLNADFTDFPIFMETPISESISDKESVSGARIELPTKYPLLK